MKKLLATMLAVIMILCAMLCASACGGTTPLVPSDPDTSTDPSGNENGDDDNDDNNKTDPYSKYSQILQNVLKSSYYQEIIDHYKNYDSKNDYSEYYEKYHPHPYNLLEKLGININKIKSRETAAYSTAYIKGDDTSKLYVTTRVENKDSTPYYHCITACYNLTEKEYKDLEMLHRERYIQAPLFIQELSYVKNPINYTYTKITIDSYNKLLQRFKSSPNLTTNVFGTNNIVLDFNYFSLKDKIFEISARTSKQKKGLIGEGQICVALLSPNLTDMTTLFNDESVFTGPTQSFGGSLEDYKNSCENITYFNMGYGTILTYVWQG